MGGSLGLSAIDEGSFFTALRKLTTDMTAPRNGVELLDANSLWLSCSIKKTFISMAKEMFDARVEELPEDAGPINNWCSEVTHGMIPSILNSINPRTIALLLNAVYFKGTWTHEFNKEYSHRGIFHSSIKGIEQKVECMMMYRRSETVYGYYQNMHIVEMPYGTDGRFVATVLMPTDGTPLADIVNLLGTKNGPSILNEFLSHTWSREIDLSLPRFKLEFGVFDLVPQLKSDFGIHDAFNRSIPHMFNAMSPRKYVYISNVLHKAVVEVNEKGTKAAAVTAVRMRFAMVFVRRPRVVIDHPFIFLIRDTRSGLLLFSGVVEDPELPL